jgi:hypothetical protein
MNLAFLLLCLPLLRLLMLPASDWDSESGLFDQRQRRCAKILPANNAN